MYMLSIDLQNTSTTATILFSRITAGVGMLYTIWYTLYPIRVPSSSSSSIRKGMNFKKDIIKNV